LWMMYGLLCAAILVQLLMGADLAQMAGEIAVVAVTSVAMILANARHGIWDQNSRPSMRGNAGYAMGAGVCVLVMLLAKSGNLLAALMAGLCTAILVVVVLTVLMRYMMNRQAQQEKELDN
ncbi:MAG: rhomboid family intramembrane serine protease, partial [Clostridia bacterium]|nr:rhomboid family intramembrane serine protease [Clostridia bacterium]